MHLEEVLQEHGLAHQVLQAAAADMAAVAL